MIEDPGSTFDLGAGVLHINKINFKDWKNEKVFNTREEANHLFNAGPKLCVGKITSNRSAGPKGLNDPLISEQDRSSWRIFSIN
jgi:hypothetical protein